MTLAATRFGAVSEEWLAFRDGDVGITSERLNKLPVILTQIESATTQKFGGIGLSPALTKAPSTMLGGDIAVDSHPEKHKHLHADAASRIKGWYSGGCNKKDRLPLSQITSGSHRPT